MNELIFLCNWYKKDKQLIAYSIENMYLWNDNSNFIELDEFINSNKGKNIFSFISYDFKNIIDKLDSKNIEYFNFPALCFWTAKKVVLFNENICETIEGKNEEYTKEINEIIENYYKRFEKSKNILFKPQITKEKYIKKVNLIKNEIQLGNTYEVNFCQLFQANHTSKLNSVSFYGYLIRKIKSPFSCYLKWNDLELFCASPERFFKSEGLKLISQPMKGTSRRGLNKKEDEILKNNLKNNIKEFSENVMITDLVRNDLSKFAVENSVNVDELCEVYTFTNVHQMISTVSCIFDKNTKFSEILKALFPMGSMTGAPKINTMKIIEKYENFKRNLFSGTIGFIKPNGDIDFNVIIRSLIYNKLEEKFYCPVGGAITIKSTAEEEYNECLLKVSKLFELLNENEN